MNQTENMKYWVKSLAVGKGFDVDFVKIRPNEEIDLHWQDTWELTINLSGSGMCTLGNTQAPFSVGDVVLIPPGTLHYHKYNEHDVDDNGHVGGIILTFENDFLKHCGLLSPEMDKVVETITYNKQVLKYNHKDAESITDLAIQMEDSDNIRQLPKIMSLLPMLAGYKSTAIASQPHQINESLRRLHSVDSYIVSNYRRKIALDDICRHIGMGKTSFCVFFKSHTGKSFITYLEEYRIDVAKSLLLRSEMPVSDICYESGFNNIPYFNRVFKKFIGLSPTDFRLSAKN